MTEEEWEATDRPQALLDWVVQAKVGGNRTQRIRKLRLVACARLRADWAQLPDEVLRVAISTAERYADRECGTEMVAVVRQSVANTFHWLKSPYVDRCYNLLENQTRQIMKALDGLGQSRTLCDTVRDVFGNPFRSVTVNPSWLTSTAVAIARQMNESRDFSAMPILADALQDAGCDSPDILNHCRGEGLHVRGCWVVGRLLQLT